MPGATQKSNRPVSGFLNSLVEIWVESGKGWEALQQETREAKLASTAAAPTAPATRS